MSLVYRGLRTFNYVDFPPAGRRLQANFSGVITFDFSTDVVANSFGSHETKKLIRTWFHVLMKINSKLKHILLRIKIINNGGSLKQSDRKGFQFKSILTFHTFFQIGGNALRE